MKFLILSILLFGCAHKKIETDKEVETFCQDLNVLYLKIGFISSNIANAKTTWTAEGGPYLRKIAANEHDQLGDISTLADPGVVQELIKNRMNK